jgi:chemotaxis protein MotB
VAKKHKCPEFENHERWLVAWADMLTLLFALFVVLYSIANVEVEKLKQVKKSIQQAFGASTTPVPEAEEGFPSGNSRVEGIFDKVKGNTRRETMRKRDRKELAAIITEDMKAVELDITNRLSGDETFAKSAEAKSDGRVVFVNRDADGIRVTLLARHFFKPSSAELSVAAYPALDAVAQAIKPLGRVVRVEGHTDALRFNLKGMTNWELSALRASSVVRYLIDRHSYPNTMIYPAGFAATRPVAPNDTPKNRGLNRRVDLKILYETPEPLADPFGKSETDEGATDTPEDTPTQDPADEATSPSVEETPSPKAP